MFQPLLQLKSSGWLALGGVVNLHYPLSLKMDYYYSTYWLGRSGQVRAIQVVGTTHEKELISLVGLYNAE